MGCDDSRGLGCSGCIAPKGTRIFAPPCALSCRPGAAGGERSARAKRREKTCSLPSLWARRPLTNATVARESNPGVQHGLRAGARNLTCGSRGVRERGHARHGAEGSSRKDKSNGDAHLEQARFDDVLDRPCERGAVKHNGFVVGDRQRGVGRRRRARGDLVVSASPKARIEVGGGWWVGCWSTCTRKHTWALQQL